MIKVLRIYFFLVPIFFLASCDWIYQKSDQFYSGLYLINVNDAESFSDARIAGSVNLSYDDIVQKSEKFDKSDKLIVYCTDYFCTESERVAKKLKRLGFENIFVYRGGIQEWYQLNLKNKDNYPLEGPALQEFLKRPIEKLDFEEDIPVISAEDLSELLKQSKKEK